jgi:long-chain acyl-CoA synthetase
MYTSGTTGTPKGVVISHRAVLSSVAGIKLLLCHYGEALTSDDCFFSYLPLAHIFDRVVEELFISIGGRIGYFQGDVKKILEDVGACKPTLFAGVPRVFERIFTGLFEKVNAGGWFKKVVFRWCYKRKLARLNQGYRPEAASPLADTLVFNQVKQKLGGRVRVIVSGGAPLASHVEEFMKVALCAPAVQGYGLTETCAASFIGNPFLMSHLGSVGVPLAHTELKLESVPEMGYDALDPNEPRGEILIRGPGLFSGYYKDEKLTADSMTSDGFFRTGDIGALVADGTLKVIDRKKNIFKLSQGEYVAVEKLESVYKKNLVSEQVWVYGNSFKSSLIAVVVPSAKLKKWAAANGIEGDMDVICKSDKAKEYVLSELAKTGKAEKLKGFEIIRAVHLAPTPFTIEEDLLTPTFKLKRPQLQKSFQKEIDALYAALKE